MAAYRKATRLETWSDVCLSDARICRVKMEYRKKLDRKTRPGLAVVDTVFDPSMQFPREQKSGLDPRSNRSQLKWAIITFCLF